MERIDINDYVEVVNVNPKDQHLSGKRGRVVMVADGVNRFVMFDDGNSASVEMS